MKTPTIMVGSLLSGSVNVGLGVYDTIKRKCSHNSIGNYQGPYIRDLNTRV